MHDIIIIGGGPAGMTAALYAVRNNKTALILEKAGFGGQIAYSPKVDNIPGLPSVSGSEFADRLLDQILALGAEVEVSAVTSIKDEGSVKRIMTEDGEEYEAKAVIIASGVTHRMLGLEGEEELVGNGISFCAVCDGDFYADQNVAIAGGGNSALQEAVLLSDVAKHIYIIQDLDHFTGEQTMAELVLSKPNVTAYTGTTIEKLIITDGALTGLSLRKTDVNETKDIECDGLFVAIGNIPQNQPFEDLVTIDDRGYIVSDETALTGVSGVYVAGDCRTKGSRQVVTACADGSVAALAACSYIDSL